MVSNRAWRYLIMGGMIVMVFLVLPRMAGSQEPTIAERMGARHWSGQSISPVYEGFDLNPDGTYNLWFGYMNLNWEEQLDIPVGPENGFDPGVDRGQPTHFDPRRHKDVFKVVVPKDFGKQKLVWKITTRGKTETIAGTLAPVWQIDRRRTTRGGSDDAIDSNTPPVASVQPPEQTIAAGTRATLALSATDDGLPKRVRTSFPSSYVPPQLYAVPPSTPPQRGGPPAQAPAGGGGGRGGGRGAAQAPAGGDGGSLSYEWFKYRGPGTVAFAEQRGILANGKATATASFSEPGDYMLQVVVDDGSGESAGNFGYHCCWTNVEVKVHVTGAAPAARH
jgi:hypothetical protein